MFVFGLNGPELSRRATHLAGHALIAIDQGLPLCRLILVPPSGLAPGLTVPRYGDCGCQLDLPAHWPRDVGRRCGLALGQLRTALAGSIAEQIDDERCDMQKVEAAQEDWPVVCESSAVLHDSPADRTELITTEVAQLDRFLRSEPMRERLSALAGKLLGHDVIWHDEIEAALRSVRAATRLDERRFPARPSMGETPMFDSDIPRHW